MQRGGQVRLVAIYRWFTRINWRYPERLLDDRVSPVVNYSGPIVWSRFTQRGREPPVGRVCTIHLDAGGSVDNVHDRQKIARSVEYRLRYREDEDGDQNEAGHNRRHPNRPS